jgi:hypothetical protein
MTNGTLFDGRNTRNDLEESEEGLHRNEYAGESWSSYPVLVVLGQPARNEAVILSDVNDGMAPAHGDGEVLQQRASLVKYLPSALQTQGSQ